MKAKLNKHINYLKEAFFNPINLIGLGIGTFITMALVTVGAIAFNFDASSLFLVLAGMEMMYLGVMAKNDRFIRAINAKYSKETTAYHKAKDIAGYYNSLSAPRQRRFEHFMKQLEEVKSNYEKMHGDFPAIVNSFLSKLNNLQLNYVRHLYMQDKLPSYLNSDTVNELKQEILRIKNSMSADAPQIQKLKEQRIQIMQKRIDAFDTTKVNAQAIGIKLQTIEEMVAYVKDQPLSISGTNDDELMIDNILFESEQLQETISDIEAIIQVDNPMGDYGPMDGNTYNSTGETTL